MLVNFLPFRKVLVLSVFTKKEWFNIKSFAVLTVFSVFSFFLFLSSSCFFINSFVIFGLFFCSQFANASSSFLIFSIVLIVFCLPSAVQVLGNHHNTLLLLLFQLSDRLVIPNLFLGRSTASFYQYF
jgi:hypothetical protein